MMKIDRLKEITKLIGNVKIAVMGDFCVDIYWILDSEGSEVSIETGLRAEAIKEHYYSLGGAANVVANLAALAPAKISVIGVVGDDIFGRELRRQLDGLGVDSTWLTIQRDQFHTVAYCKRYLNEQELPRIDFGFRNHRSRETDQKLLNGLEEALQSTDVLIFNQQVPGSLPLNEFFAAANKLFKKYANKIVLLDSRHYGDRFENIYRKTNEAEAASLVEPGSIAKDKYDREEIERIAESIFKKSGKPVFITRGERGLSVCDQTGVHWIPGIQILRQIDSVGAGDTIVSALACCLAAGITPKEAAEFANYAAVVTVQKLFKTGTASPPEILEIANDPDVIYQPELAEDIRRAIYYKNSDIEICCDLGQLQAGKIKHAVFDHDGTISTLRQGWNQVMEQMMKRTILGDQYNSADQQLVIKIEKRVYDYIEKSTGIQTILQMQALVEMAKEFDLVPAARLLDAWGYKKIFNDALMQHTKSRFQKLQNGELDYSDFTIKGSVAFLRELRNRGVILYLASGTDVEDVENEAAILGYADLFDGGIYGAVGDIEKCSKKLVMRDIIQSHNLQGPELVCFGDGPVEMRECRKQNGITVGVASNEIRRFGLNPEKRERLIKGGANFIIPDFSQMPALLEILFS